ncbi:uncharacterized protein LOC134259429 [Saccostrea cucullata]|uniref:uncharacterized protein LOC134259429 n=1 Tax=Saccostrea cuccullata TaxID=36930 RepID=UPI002ED05C14
MILLSVIGITSFLILITMVTTIIFKSYWIEQINKMAATRYFMNMTAWSISYDVTSNTNYLTSRISSLEEFDLETNVNSNKLLFVVFIFGVSVAAFFMVYFILMMYIIGKDTKKRNIKWGNILKRKPVKYRNLEDDVALHI